MKQKILHPVHPGGVLLEEFLDPPGLSRTKLAVSIGVPARRINEIVLEKRQTSADTALSLPTRGHGERDRENRRGDRESGKD
jgi:antitoxin HigA-1